MALLQKNFILAYRNRTATFLRVFSSFFFILLIYLVNIGLKARFSADSYFRDYPDPPRTVVQGIPSCVKKSGVSSACVTFAYCPAPDLSGQGIHPDVNYQTAADFTATGCPASKCSEMFRVHRLVRSIMVSNVVASGPAPIPPTNVLGFGSEANMDQFLLANPETVQVRGCPHWTANWKNGRMFTKMLRP